jgi:hypothetical protein
MLQLSMDKFRTYWYAGHCVKRCAYEKTSIEDQLSGRVSDRRGTFRQRGFGKEAHSLDQMWLNGKVTTTPMFDRRRTSYYHISFAVLSVNHVHIVKVRLH